MALNFNSAPIHPDKGQENKYTIKILSRIEDLTRLGKKLLDCSKGIFNVTQEENLERLRDILLNRGKIYYVLNWQRQIVGYAASEKIPLQTRPGETEEAKGFYFSNDVVNEKRRRRGIYREINRSRVGDAIKEKARFVYLSTQNPNVELSLRNVFKELSNKKQTPIAGFEFEIKRNSTRNHMPVTQEKPPKCGIPDIDKRYATLDYDKGETFVIIVHITYR